MEAFIILTILITVFLVIGGRWAKNFFRCCCHECGTKMQPYEKLSDSDKADILEYFRRFEDREPDVEGIFACGNCLLVYDDFSGEKRWREATPCTIFNNTALPYSTKPQKRVVYRNSINFF